MEKIEINVETKHFAMCSFFTDVRNCPLALAIREQLNLKVFDVCVGGITVDIYNYNYKIGKNWQYNVIQNMIDKAKNGEKTKTIVVTLTKI